MIDTLPTPQVGTQAAPRTRGPNERRSSTSGGLLATCALLALACGALGTRIYSQGARLNETRAQLAQANFRDEQTQGNLAAAKAQASAVEAQLAADQGQISDLQAQASQAKARDAGLQADLASGRTQLSNAQGQLELTRAQLAGAQAQLSGAARDSSALRGQLEQAKGQAADAQAQLLAAQGQLAKLHPLIAEARRLPLALSFEKSFWDQRFTLHINNPGAATLRLRITVSGQDGAKTQSADIEGGATLNVPSLPAGDSVAIASDGFDTQNLTAR